MNLTPTGQLSIYAGRWWVSLLRHRTRRGVESWVEYTLRRPFIDSRRRPDVCPHQIELADVVGSDGRLHRVVRCIECGAGPLTLRGILVARLRYNLGVVMMWTLCGRKVWAYDPRHRRIDGGDPGAELRLELPMSDGKGATTRVITAYWSATRGLVVHPTAGALSTQGGGGWSVTHYGSGLLICKLFGDRPTAEEFAKRAGTVTDWTRPYSDIDPSIGRQLAPILAELGLRRP